ncbi:166_t:CDS:2 [Scutellospora calospora]|uniref:166_t:CDS:1 n=1 Tax=Scutellospora calospora TaxID=85575 RepID=A0ACA9L050_9GLOM|nr:166_t:CDS:2 [Scutellospora calospora]
MVRDSIRFYCTICTRSKKGYKSYSGLQRHETSKHASYNLLPNHIQQIPKSELDHLKNAIIKELQKKLKNHYRAIGEQVFSIHCSENAFVGIFGSYITRYSPCGSFYFCNFRGENAVETIGLIFNNNQWYQHDYEMIVEWRVIGFKDKANKEYKAGTLKIRFFIDQCQF